MVIEIKRTKKRAYKNTNRDDGLCPNCGGPHTGGKRVCLNCREVRRKFLKGLVEQGLCTNCQQPTDGFRATPGGKSRFCETCKKNERNSAKLRARAKKMAGKCVDCGGSISGSSSRCVSCREKNAEHTRRLNRRRRIEILKHYGGKCACCGEDRMIFLAIDHIDDGGGNDHRRSIGGAANLTRWLEYNNYPEGFQILCHLCNVGRHQNGGVCPHKDPSACKTVWDDVEP